MAARDDELLRWLALLQRLTHAARLALSAPTGDPLKEALAKLTTNERAMLDEMRGEAGEE
jgi:hypothetical protein